MAPQTDIGELTAREREVAVLVSRGVTNPEVAAALTITENTVRSHLREIIRK